jgi:hypothetical protein
MGREGNRRVWEEERKRTEEERKGEKRKRIELE